MEEKQFKSEMMIKFYNMKHNRSFKFTDANLELGVKALEKGENLEVVKDFIREFDGKNSTFASCMNSFIEDKIDEVIEVKPIDVVKVDNTIQPIADGANLLEQALSLTIGKIQDQKRESSMEDIKKDIDKYIFDNYGKIERKVTLLIDEVDKVEVDGVTHPQFDTVLKFVANNEPVFLTGGAGTGKNVLCQQIAKTLNLDFYFSNAVTQEHKITGFTDAMGVYHETQFYKAFKNGGLFMLDEMDASIPEVLIILNAAIANRYFDFPAPVGYVDAHPDFRVISAGNTYGTGADYEYVGRSQLDMASLDRFAMVKINYDRDIALNVCDDDLNLVNFAWNFRESAKKNGFNIVVSYRAISRIHKLSKIMDLKEVLETCLIKGMDKDDLKMIVKEMTDGSVFKIALEGILND